MCDGAHYNPEHSSKLLFLEFSFVPSSKRILFPWQHLAALCPSLPTAHILHRIEKLWSPSAKTKYRTVHLADKINRFFCKNGLPWKQIKNLSSIIHLSAQTVLSAAHQQVRLCAFLQSQRLTWYFHIHHTE